MNYQVNPPKHHPMVVAFAQGDVNGDCVIDQVYLTGTKTPDSPFTQNIVLHIRDGRTGMIGSIPLSENTGYNPTLFLGDFTGNGVDEILISIATGGSGGIMNAYIVSYIGNQARFIFDSSVYNNRYTYSVNYLDQYKVELISDANNEKYVIDLSLRDKSYLNEIYDANGKLKQPITGFVNPLSGIYPVDFDLNGVDDLLIYQKIAGRYNADSLGYFLNTLVWKNNRFVLQNQYVAIYGTEM
ncbi:VCBS repeat-containing protein [Sporosarcina saromensis]|uniref:VCBS repeat-containing protein n=1 Tax=Sporosarcina saromensis TaxID=359365 RepID=A0ABU4GCL3_9BACL|nr:VCBS repeat-containing protein [Sporosarcina saromensis]MDW0114726.1 VCBS repeat-containing protein [Sporosarcina saromensis]